MLLPPNPVYRFYKGGDGIDTFRGVAVGSGPGAPEDWVGSATTVLNQPASGLAKLGDGRYLRDAIESDPDGYLGSEHVAALGPNPGLLVKLLDAGQRLAVHYHPGRPFARRLLGLPNGKTESWIVLAAEPGAHMNLGLKEPLEPGELERWVRQQSSDEMLDALHTVPVKAGDALFVPAGTLHTIGEGITLIELQEPADMSVVIEARASGVPDDEARLYRDWVEVLAAANTDASQPIHGPVSTGSPRERLLPKAADPYFRAERITVGSQQAVAVEPSFAIVIGTDGELELTVGDSGQHPLELARGACALVPFGAGNVTFSGQGTAIRCLPPLPDAGEGSW